MFVQSFEYRHFARGLLSSELAQKRKYSESLGAPVTGRSSTKWIDGGSQGYQRLCV